MSLAEDIKKRMFAAIKAGNTVEKEILRVAMGEITMTAARESKDLSDEEVQGVLKKLLKSARESIAAAPDDQKATLQQEIDVLEGFLPKSLSVDEIVAALADVKAAIQAAPAAGPAVGIAMKQLKVAGLSVEAPAVQAAIAQIRG